MLITATFQPPEDKKSSDELHVVIRLTSQMNISNHKGRNHLMIKDIHKTTNLDLNFTKTHKERVILWTREQMLSVFQQKIMKTLYSTQGSHVPLTFLNTLVIKMQLWVL